MSKHVATILIGLFIILHAFTMVQAEKGTSSDPIGNAWKLRSEAATKKLAESGLDVCDKAIESAFKDVTETFSGKQRTFELRIVIGDQAMIVMYNYKGQELEGIGIAKVPPRWMITQKADSKIISVLIIDSNCAFDLCTNDPFSKGPCSDQSTR